MKMWSGRMAEAPDEGFDRWQRSFGFDRRLLAYECAASSAHAHALAKAGLLSKAELDAIVKALAGIAERGQDPAALENSPAEDVHHFVELELVAAIGEAGYKLHSGRSRNEQIATDLRLFTRDSIDRLIELTLELAGVLCDRAADLGSAIMPAYTHLQRAEPVLAAHWLLAYVEMLFRDAERLRDCRKRVNVLPLGSGAVAGASFPLDRAGMARELGFGTVTANSMDAVSDRDFEIEFLNCMALAGVHLSRLAEDVILYCSVEFGFVLLPDAYATGSSAMPQKKNPDAMELLRGKAARLLGEALSSQVLMKGLPLTYDRDLQELQEPLFSATDSLASCLRIAADFMRALEFDREKMRRAAQCGHLNATAAANYLVRKGVPFRRAHALVGEMVRYCLDRGLSLESLKEEELGRFSPQLSPDFARALELESVVNEHDLPGGTAIGRVQRALEEARERLRNLREVVGAYA